MVLSSHLSSSTMNRILQRSQSTLLLLLAFMCSSVPAVAQEISHCDTCATVHSILGRWKVKRLADTSIQVVNRDEQVLFRNVRSLQRATMYLYGRPHQGLRVRYMLGDTCRDSVIFFNGPLTLRRDVISVDARIDIPLLPACEYYCGEPPKPSEWFLGIHGVGAYTGMDTSHRMTGSNQLLFGGRAVVGIALPIDFDLALGVEAFSERGRLRLPAFGHVRWYPFGSEKTESYFKYVPDECRFGGSSDTATAPSEAWCIRADKSSECDPTSYFVEDLRRIVPWLQPFLFGEGGLVLNGKFEGAGVKPSLNSQEYGQYFGGAGVGLRMFGAFVLSAGYRYMRLNNRTPCESCPDQFVVNTNVIHAATLTLGFETR